MEYLKQVEVPFRKAKVGKRTGQGDQEFEDMLLLKAGEEFVLQVGTKEVFRSRMN